MMLRTPVLAAAALLIGAAGDIPANRRALDEASTFLSDACEISNPQDAKVCRRLQNDFLLDYLRAMSGDTLSMKKLAGYFGGHSRGEVSASKLRSCAWAVMAEMSPSPTEDGSSVDGTIDAYCQALPPNDFQAAKHLATVTSIRIEHAPAKAPKARDGDPWPGTDCDTFTVAYAARGQFTPPACKPHVGPLDSTVTPPVP